MILLIRENASNQSVDFLWNVDTSNWKGSKSYFTKPIAELESFWKSWESLVFRNGNTIPIQDEIAIEIQKKREWMIGLVGFRQIESSLRSKVKAISIQSDSKWISLPWELLVDDNNEAQREKQIVREFLTPNRHFSHTIADQAFFLFQTEFGGRLELSLEREYDQLKALNWKKLTPQFFKNGLARVERVKEILPSAKIFHLASHLDPGRWTMPDGSIITRSEIESMNLSGLELVFLNGCYSTFGLAQSFLRAGAREVVGFSTAIPNELSEQVSKLFWTEWTKTSSSFKAYLKVRKYLENSIFLYSWIRFGEGKLRQVRPWIFYLKISLIPLIIIGILFLLFSQINQRLEEIVRRQKNSIEKISNSPNHITDDKSSHAIKKERKVLNPVKDSHKTKVNEEVNIQSKPQIEKTAFEEEYRSKLPPSFLNEIQLYIEDESELVPRTKRILLVKRILEQNQSLDWKQEVFHRETGR